MFLKHSRVLIAVAVVGVSVSCGWAESALPLLAGWDPDRIESVFGDDDPDHRAGELARLIYRVARQPASRYENLVTAGQEAYQAGDAIGVDGTVRGIAQVRVPESLVEFVEFEQVHRIDLEPPNSRKTIQIWIAAPPNSLAPGDRIEGAGVTLIDTDSTRMVAMGSLRWFPAALPHPDLQPLVEAGFNMTLVDQMRTRQRKPLEAIDSEAFYALLKLGDQPSPSTAASRIDTIRLLTDAESITGHRVRVRLDMVQSIRVAVTDPARQAQLGADHYYQLDGFADLGDQEVVVRSSDPDSEPVTFGGRYPVSIASVRLPESITPRALDASPRNVVYDVDAFFFRLWSYQSDLMRDRGVDQFGPLLIAGSFDPVPLPVGDPVGVGRIGAIAAAALTLGIIGVAVWHRWTLQGDREARRRRNASTIGDGSGNVN